MLFEERKIAVRDLQVSVKIHNPSASRKVLALHGWLDNAGSFDVLAPLLHDCCVLAVDLPGQGFSDARPATSDYHLWNDVVDMYLLTRSLGWEQFSLLGHSRGGMLSVMLAASYPECIEQLFLVDGIMPLPVEVDACVSQLRQYVDAMSAEALSPKSKRYYAEREAAVTVRAKAGGIPESIADILAQRNLHKTPEGWFWAADERLKGASAIKLTEAHNRAFLGALECPVHLYLADKGFAKHPCVESWKSLFPQFDWQTFEGHHHLHMDADMAVILAERILDAFGEYTQ